MTATLPSARARGSRRIFSPTRRRDERAAKLRIAIGGTSSSPVCVTSNHHRSHAEVATFTTESTNINFFAHYAAVPDEGVLEYHYSCDDFKKGRRQLRNLQDDARHLSYALRDRPRPLEDTCQTLGGDVPEEAELDHAEEQAGVPGFPPSYALAGEEIEDIPAAHNLRCDDDGFIHVPSLPGSSKQAPQPDPRPRRRAAASSEARPRPVEDPSSHTAKKHRFAWRRTAVEDG
ncbi:hypothetical protein N658DRAFT_487769 [Parathielavia hyrcaniae]|uniref:Uncharacterized protein n=1 Tax=Parathielavia hyrcaniae TaxID=113614 RepID=A0AAN6SZC5_9PEZI|nr:hypothetical protein N658DRAFT_487769 [Parathielavia hyrcaniae]